MSLHLNLPTNIVTQRVTSELMIKKDISWKRVTTKLALKASSLQHSPIFISGCRHLQWLQQQPMQWQWWWKAGPGGYSSYGDFKRDKRPMIYFWQEYPVSVFCFKPEVDILWRTSHKSSYFPSLQSPTELKSVSAISDTRDGDTPCVHNLLPAWGVVKTSRAQSQLAALLCKFYSEGW